MLRKGFQEAARGALWRPLSCAEMEATVSPGGRAPPEPPPAIVIKTALFGAIGVPDKHETVGTRTPACSEKAWKSDQNTLCSASFRARARRQCRVRISNYNIEPGGAGGCCSAGLASLRRVCMESL